ncbi:MAG: hypothetical protein ABT940_04115 [Alphaproteobacteria bacterium]
MAAFPQLGFVDLPIVIQYRKPRQDHTDAGNDEKAQEEVDNTKYYRTF